MVSYSSDGSLVLFGAAGIDVYDGHLQRRSRHMDISDLAMPPGIGEFTHAVSPDGTVAAVAYSPNPTISNDAWGMNSRLGIYRISDGTLLNMLEIPDAGAAPYLHALMALAISPGGALVYANTVGDGTAKGRVVDTMTGTLLWTGDAAWAEPNWSADGTTLFGLYEDPSSGSDTSLDALDGTSGMVKWRTKLYDPAKATGSLLGVLALTGNGSLLTGPATENPYANGTCPPDYPFWSTGDGGLTRTLPAVPGSSFFGLDLTEGSGFVCNATETCAVLISVSNSSYVRVFKTDGTQLLEVPPQDGASQGSMAISPDGQFITIAPVSGLPGAVNVYRIVDGAIVGSL
jgi:hypothetical protein